MTQNVFTRTLIMAAASLMVTSGAALAGSQNYDYLKTCTFNSTQLGLVTLRLFKDNTVGKGELADRAILITSGSNATPVIADDLNVIEKFDGVLGARLLKASATYVTSQTRWITIYENPKQGSWGRLKITYVAEAKVGKRAEVYGEEVVDTDACAAAAF